MRFKKIKLHGFKSFAEPVTVEFNRGITCIVGPNGSGKSNISDAIRWVLGEQSPKMLRGGKMEEVIFAGTAGRKSRGMAEVTLVIDNEDGSLPIDYKEVAITRRMFRSGESEYHINGNQCRLRDIRELIMDTGIGVDGYSIIGQGKISEIISNKTEGRREIFEEAAGIVLYRTKKAESEKKLAAASANMERVSDIVGEIRGRIDGLREESVKAKEYTALRERYRELEINIILKNAANLEEKNRITAADIAALSTDIDSGRKKKIETEKKLSQYGQRSEELEAASEQSRKMLISAIDALNAAQNKEQIDKEKITSIETNRERIREELERLYVRIEREDESASALAVRKRESDRKYADVTERLNEKENEREILEAETEALAEAAEKCRSEMFELSGIINAKKSEKNSLTMMQETLMKRRKVLLEEKDSDTDNNKETLDRLNRIRSEQNYIEESLYELRERIAEYKEDLAAARSEERSLADSIGKMRIELGQLSTRKKTIEELESNYEGYNHAVRHIMKSGLTGIRGVVANLIKVPKGYETAIETAMGAALQNIVCDDDKSAEAAIESLKRNKAGRMTFLPVSSVKGNAYKDNKLIKEPGFTGFGPDCMKFDREYTDIINYLMGRVVIVDNMENAVKMSKKTKGVRFVTLEGEVINSGGAITGGRYRNKSANILDRKSELVSLQADMDKKSRMINEAEISLATLVEKCEDLSEKISEYENMMIEQDRLLISKKSEAEVAEGILQDIRSSGEKLSRELDNIDLECDNSSAMTAEIDEAIAEAERRIKDAEKQSLLKLSEYNEKKQMLDKLNDELTDMRIEAGSCEKDKEHMKALAERIAVSAEELRSQINDKKHKLDTFEEERRRISSDSGKGEALIRQKEEEKKALEEKLEDIKAEKTELSRMLTLMNEEKDTADDVLESLQSQKYELEIRKARNETQLDTYKNRLWDDFEISYIQAVELEKKDFSMSAAIKESRAVKDRLKELGEVNIGAIEEYEIVSERYEFLKGQQADIMEGMDDLNRIISDMDKTIKTRFKESFDRIVINFEEKFKELFGGGHAELRLSDEKDPLGSDIDIVAQPPGKKLQNINLLSGGEKTLTAIALMFAVLKAKPTPFCILDEIEAALDDANIDRFISCLRKFTGIQFALVTHQKATMEHADALYGVTMPEKGVSKVLSLNMNDNFEV